MPHIRRPPKRFIGNDTTAHTPTTPEEHYRADFFKVLDTVDMQLKERFHQSGLTILAKLEEVLLTGELDTAVVDQYPELNQRSLKVQLDMFKLQYPFKSTSEAAAILRSQLPEVRGLFDQVEALIRLLMVVPAASAEAERSFSALRRLKTWLRSTMMQIRINNVAVCHIHKELLGKVSREKICQEFILANEYRKHGKKEIKKNAKTGKHDEMKASQKQQMLTGSMRSMRSEPTGGESEMLAELRKLRQENSESFKDTKLSINRLESSMTEIKQQIEQLDERITTAENKVSAMEDRSIRQERAVGYLLRREASLAAKCDDMEN
ncbi:hypothetical protein F7725_007327 [Dissostichus mawsoni]|uniref:HAT C-terminal dimerisation domain-containing protein n=1 Tax=Dissostichus mawsoni TaxID=36200 RepID=A0A7J5XWH6_DISMA|nr:hypothetical protein F7725_007327 [Dissostichus mawsoni]